MLTPGIRRLLVLHLLAALGITGLAGAAPAQARGDICVGVVVDTTQLGGDVETGCATVPDGSDGVDVLDATGHELTVCRDGIIGEIDGRPADGCATKDSTHYWSYWHRAAGSTSWTYATEGPSTYQPGNRSTEGWVFQDGRSESDNQPPPATAYRRICPKSASPSGSPPPVGTNYKPPGAPTTPPPPPTATAAPAPTAAPVPAPVKRTHRQRQKHPATMSATPTPTASDSTSTTPTATPTRVVSLPDDNGSSGPPIGLVVGIVAAVALGGATAWQVRRQRSSP